MVGSVGGLFFGGVLGFFGGVVVGREVDQGVVVVVEGGFAVVGVGGSEFFDLTEEEIEHDFVACKIEANFGGVPLFEAGMFFFLKEFEDGCGVVEARLLGFEALVFDLVILVQGLVVDALDAGLLARIVLEDFGDVEGVLGEVGGRVLNPGVGAAEVPLMGREGSDEVGFDLGAGIEVGDVEVEEFLEFVDGIAFVVEGRLGSWL